MIDSDSDTDKSFDFQSVKCSWIDSNTMILDRQGSHSSSHKHSN